MNLKKSFFLFSVSLLLFMGVLIFKIRPPAVVSQYLGQQVLPVTLDQIERVGIAAGQEQFTITRQEDGWIIAGSKPLLASHDFTKIFLRSLAALRPLQKIPSVSEDQLDIMGLQQPSWVFTIKARWREQPILLKVGKPSLDGSSLYVYTPSEGPEVYLVDIFNKKFWPTSFYDLLPRDFFANPPHLATRIRVSAQDKGIELYRSGDLWKASGVNTQDTKATEALTRAVLGLKWDRILEEKESFHIKINLDIPDWLVEVQYDDQTTQRLGVSTFGDFYYLENPHDPQRVLRLNESTMTRLQTAWDLASGLIH